MKRLLPGLVTLPMPPSFTNAWAGTVRFRRPTTGARSPWPISPRIYPTRWIGGARTGRWCGLRVGVESGGGELREIRAHLRLGEKPEQLPVFPVGGAVERERGRGKDTVPESGAGADGRALIEGGRIGFGECADTADLIELRPEVLRQRGVGIRGTQQRSRAPDAGLVHVCARAHRTSATSSRRRGS